MTPPPLTLARARWLIVFAGVLWSLSSLFIRVLGEDTPLGLNGPNLSPLQIAFYRGLFAGLVLLPLVRRADVRFRPRMAGMVGCFAVMNAVYLSALALGPAANAILLQNTAPLWVYLFGVYWLGGRADPRTLLAVTLGVLGAAVIVAGNWSGGGSGGGVPVLLMGLGSGVVYAGVILFLRSLRDESPTWLVSLNLLGSAACLGTFVLLTSGFAEWRAWVTAPTAKQLAFIAVFGAVQMATPYVLFTRGLKVVTPQEAGIITLIEPVLNPVWAYLIAPAKETPTVWTLFGGTLLLAALAWRYLPRRTAAGR